MVLISASENMCKSIMNQKNEEKNKQEITF